MRPELVASLVIRSLRDDASAATGIAVRRCVAACPANFSGPQKAALREAFELAGLDVMRMVGEPNSAGMLPLPVTDEALYLVVDLGGGTVDIALIEVGDGVSEIRSVAGNNELGGLDYDEAILGVVRSRLVTAHPGLVLSDHVMVDLRREAERAKRLLSTREETVVVARDLPTVHGLEDVELVVRRDDVRSAVRHLDAEITRLIRTVLGNAAGGGVRVAARDVARVVFSGSGGKMFTVREAVRAAGVRAEFIDTYQELAVVQGLGRQAGVLTGAVKETLLLDVTHRAFGCHVEQIGPERFRKTTTTTGAEFEVLLGHSVTIPTKTFRTVTFVGASDEPLTLRLVEQSRTTGSVVPVGALRTPLPGAAVEVELIVDIDANGTIAVEVDDLTNKTARTYHLTERDSGGYAVDHRMRLLAEGWTLHEPRQLTPAAVADDTEADHTRAETITTIDSDAEMAAVTDQPVAQGYLLTGLGRAGEALGLLVPRLADRPRYEFTVPPVCTAVCVALARLPAKYRQAGVRAVVDRLIHVTSRQSYDPRTDHELAVCVARLSALGPTPEIIRFTEHLAAIN